VGQVVRKLLETWKGAIGITVAAVGDEYRPEAEGDGDCDRGSSPPPSLTGAAIISCPRMGECRAVATGEGECGGEREWGCRITAPGECSWATCWPTKVLSGESEPDAERTMGLEGLGERATPKERAEAECPLPRIRPGTTGPAGQAVGAMAGVRDCRGCLRISGGGPAGGGNGGVASTWTRKGWACCLDLAELAAVRLLSSQDCGTVTTCWGKVSEAPAEVVALEVPPPGRIDLQLRPRCAAAEGEAQPGGAPGTAGNGEGTPASGNGSGAGC